jgi:hypothetical protein
VGSITDILTLTGEYAYANDFEVRLKALTDLAIDGPGLIVGGIDFAWLAVIDGPGLIVGGIDFALLAVIDGPGLIVGGIDFAWLAVWFLSPDWLCRILEVCEYF